VDQNIINPNFTVFVDLITVTFMQYVDINGEYAYFVRLRRSDHFLYQTKLTLSHTKNSSLHYVVKLVTWSYMHANCAVAAPCCSHVPPSTELAASDMCELSLVSWSRANPMKTCCRFAWLMM